MNGLFVTFPNLKGGLPPLLALTFGVVANEKKEVVRSF